MRSPIKGSNALKHQESSASLQAERSARSLAGQRRSRIRPVVPHQRRRSPRIRAGFSSFRAAAAVLAQDCLHRLHWLFFRLYWAHKASIAIHCTRMNPATVHSTAGRTGISHARRCQARSPWLSARLIPSVEARLSEDRSG